MSVTRFVIVSEERTGSTLLQMLLDSHPNILCLGELLNDDIRVRDVGADDSRPLGDNENPVDYLDMVFRSKSGRKTTALGFRLFYTHATEAPWSALREYLYTNTSVRIIHLIRDNLLDRYLSYRLAERSEIWIEFENSEARTDLTPIRLEVDDCLESFKESERHQEETARLFANHPYLEVKYESLVENPGTVLTVLQDFLGVKRRELESATRKQRQYPKRQVIENFDELRGYFCRGIEKGWSNARWRDFFDDT